MNDQSLLDEYSYKMLMHHNYEDEQSYYIAEQNAFR